MPTSVDARTVDKWRELVNKLSYATKARVITWKDTSQEGVYLSNVARNVVRFGADEDADGTTYFVRIQDSSGKEVEGFTDSDLTFGYGGEYRDKMRAMHIDITRFLNGADQVLDSLLSALPDEPKAGTGSSLDDDIPF